MDEVIDTYELSPLQEGMLFHALGEQHHGVDIEQIVIAMDEPLDVELFMRAWQRVLDRHTILRTRFRWQDVTEPRQEVLARVELVPTVADWSNISAPLAEQRFAAQLAADRRTGFDLSRAPPMRLFIAHLGTHSRVLWTFHHALLDGRSFAIVLRELFAIHDALRNGSDIALPAMQPYGDYIAWRRTLDARASEPYWRELLQGFHVPTRLGVDDAKGAHDPAAADAQPFAARQQRLSRLQTDRLRSAAAYHDVTLNTLVQAAWALLLHRYSGEADIVFGATRAARSTGTHDASESVGLFINTLPMRVRVDRDAPLGAWLQALRAQQIAVRPHEHASLASVQAWSAVARGTPLFESAVVYDHQALDARMQMPGRRFEYIGQTNFPLVLIAYGDDEMLLRVEYSTARFSDAAMERLLGHLENLLVGLADAKTTHVRDLDPVSAAERALLVGSEPIARYTTAHATLHEAFAAQVARTPDAIALSIDTASGREDLSYAALDRRTESIARHLRALGVVPDQLVGLRVERSADVVVGILAILKAGGAYLPLDPVYPTDRIAFMLDDAEVRIVLTQRALATELAALPVTCVCLDEPLPPAPALQSSGATAAGENLAYVIYTSGSTGKPKGVRITHRNVLRLFAATDAWFGFEPGDVWTLFHSYAFDFSVWEIWGALLYGGRVVVVPQETSRDPAAFRELLLRERVTVLNQTPTAFRQLIDADRAAQPGAFALRYVVFGGEALELQSLKPWFDRYGDDAPRLINMYGITETTVHVTYRPIRLADLAIGAGSVIGVPIPDLRVYLLDPHGQPVPIGVAGEMYVAGAGVAAGYLKRPELTAQRFVPDPFQSGDARMYRTGDLARRLDTGELEYLGRIDQQVKIRGFRIELGEIEAAIAQHPAVRQVAVVDREDTPGEKKLVAYLVAQSSPSLIGELRDALRLHLPDYMVPAHFLHLDTLPLTPNGKLDRKALPAPEHGRAESGRPYVAPRNTAEQTIADVWKAVLRVDRVGVDDHFFELGGDSILSIQVIARCNQRGLRFTPKDLFKHPTVAQLAKIARVVETRPNETSRVGGVVLMTPIQHWFFEQEFSDPNHWNQAFLFELVSRVDGTVLEDALRRLILHHDALRLRCRSEGGGGPLEYASEPQFVFRSVDLTQQPSASRSALVTEHAECAQGSLDISEGRLLCAVHFAMGPGEGDRLLLIVHHLAVDGVSWRILVEDLDALCVQLAEGRAPTLPDKTSSFQAWSEKLGEYSRSADLEAARGYWIEPAKVSPSRLPSEGSDPANLERSARSIKLKLDASETRDLLQRAPGAYRTHVNDLLLTALALALAEWTGRHSFVIELEGHGREDLFDDIDLSRTVGWFTTLFPVALDIGDRTELGDVLKTIKQRVRDIPDRGLSYGLLRCLRADASAAIGDESRPDLLFNYLGQFDQVIAGSNRFRFAREAIGHWHAPNNKRTHALEVLCAVRDGCFETEWIHNPAIHSSETIGKVAADFVDALRRLIAHCLSPGAGGHVPADFPLASLGQAALDALWMRYPGFQDLYPLSALQQGMLFHCLYEPSTPLYWTQYVRTLEGPLEPGRLRQAWRATVDRHAVLRTAFLWEGFDAPLQIVVPKVEPEWNELNWGSLSTDAADAEIERYLQEDRRHDCDLARQGLHRVALIRLGGSRHCLVWSSHHLLLDGWSLHVVLQEWLQIYDALVTSGSMRLPRTEPFRDYIGWTLRQHPGESLSVWRQWLKGFTAPTPLPIADLPDVAPNSDNYSTRACPLPKVETIALQELGRRHGLTLNTLVQGAWALLLSRYSGESDIVFGTTVSGRPPELDGFETMVGLFINTLPCRTRIESDRPALMWLQDLQTQQIELRQYEHTPLAQIQACSELQRGTSLFDTIVVFENYPVDEALKRRSNPALGPARFIERTNFALTATAHVDGTLCLQLMYPSARFSEATIDRALSHWRQLLGGIAADIHRPLRNLQLLTEAERRLLVLARNTEQVYPVHASLHELFEAWATRTPDAIALSCGSDRLTYGELNARANRVARALREHAAGPDILVGLFFERSNDLIVGLLGILKAGSAYLPIDPAYPPERVAFMLGDAEAPLLLTQRRLFAQLPAVTAGILCIEDIESTPPPTGATENLLSSSGPDHLAYVIYTSGTTGKPKGSMITHRNVVRLFAATQEWYRFDASDVWTLFHSIAFDFSVWELWGALLHGGRLVVVRYLTSRSPDAFYELLADEAVTVLNQTPSAFRQLVVADETGGSRNLALRYVIFGGEALDMQSLHPWFARHDDMRPQLVNMYGITETTVHVTYRPITRNDLKSASVIGMPIPDLQVYILDGNRQPVPIGVAGEMYVGGSGLAKGYLRRPELTNDRFVPDTLTGREGKRLYRTGDLARFLPDFDIEYLGRIDHQVKIRGFRIELGEIESVLSQHPAVRASVVLAREDTPGDKRLVAYLVTNGQPSLNELREHARRQLPEYMLPAATVFLDSLPLTDNGKIDRKALPAPQQSRPELAKDYKAPRTPLERQLAAIWAKVLRLERVGIDDNFFELGGDSILSIQIVSLVRNAGFSITLKTLFEHQTVAELAAFARPASSESQAEQGAVRGNAPLTPVQRWFCEQNLVEPSWFNQAFLFTLRETIDIGSLRKAATAVERHHDALRLRLPKQPVGAVEQSFVGPEPVEIQHIVLDAAADDALPAAIEAACTHAQSSLDMAQGPLWRIAYLDLGRARGARLLIAIHHLAVDAVSWRILIEDLETAYREAQRHVPIDLPPKTDSFKHWAELHADSDASGELRAQADYWASVCRPEFVRLPADIADQRTDATKATTCSVSTVLEPRHTTALLQQAPAAYNTQINDLLLTALAEVLLPWCKGDAVCVNLEGHGREDVFAGVDVSRTIGWFTTIYPVRLSLPADAAGPRIKFIKEMLRGVPHKGFGYGVCRYVAGDARLAACEPDILFNYLGQVENTADSALFGPANESQGPEHAPSQRPRYALEIDVQVMRGRLEARIRYNGLRYREQTMAELLARFSQSLVAIIEHCTSADAGGFTPSDFPLCDLDQATLDRLLARTQSAVDIYPLSPIQNLFFVASASGVSLFDHWSCELHGPLDADALRASWRTVIAHHPILSTTFHSHDLPDPLQVVHAALEPAWTIEDWRGFDGSDQAARWDRKVRGNAAQGLDLANGPVMGIFLARCTEARWRMLWSVPALMLDGWSWPLVFRDLSLMYAAKTRGVNPSLDAARPYRDYIAWLKLRGQKSDETFWRSALTGFGEPTTLRGDAPAAGPRRFAKHSATLDADFAARIRKAARTMQVTPNALIQAGWSTVLGRASGQSDVVFGAAFAGRPTDLPGAEGIVGPFVNNLPVRVQLDPVRTGSDFLRSLHAWLLDVAPHQFTSLAQVQSWSEVPWRFRLFDSMVVVQNYIVDDAARHLGADVQIRDLRGPVHTNFPLLLLVTPADVWEIEVTYDASILSDATVGRWTADFVAALGTLSSSPATTIGALLEQLSKPVATTPAKRAWHARPLNPTPPTTDTERRIAGVWRSLFGLEDVGITENLFDLGAHSLLIVRLYQQLRQELGAEFTLIKLFEHSTIQSFAAFLDRPQDGGADRTSELRDRAQRQREAMAKSRRLFGPRPTR